MNETFYLIDEFVTVTPGKAFRLFPFGRLVKNGTVREITRQLAERFRLPHFKPPIKLGSHAETTAAGGHIVALEVRDDGLYAVPEYTEEGNEALAKGAYRYHSPEVVWDGWLENPLTGEKIEGPMIVGDALLHTPHLGEATALYSIDVIEGDEIMTTNQDMVSISALERLKEWFTNSTPPSVAEQEPQHQEPQPTENYQAQYEAKQAEAEQLAARINEYEAREQLQERVTHFAAEFKEVEAVKENQELFSMLAGFPEETAERLTVIIKALAEQVRVSNLTADVGNAGRADGGDPVAEFDAAIKQVMKDEGVNYAQALEVVRVKQPDVFNAWYGGSK